MKYHFLSYRKLLALKFYDFVLKKMHKNETKFDKPTYLLTKNLTPKESSEINRVGLYFDDKKNLVIIKKHKFRKIDADFLYLLNEASVLSMLSKFTNPRAIVGVPNLITFGVYKNELFVVSEFVSGKTVSHLNINDLTDILTRSLKYLSVISGELKKKDYGMMKKSGLYFLAVFPIILVKLFLRSPRHLIIFSKLSIYFYWNYLLGKPLNKSLYLTHCELFQDSILFDKKSGQIKLIDWEAAILSDKYYELALISRYYFETLDSKQLNMLTKLRVESLSDFRRYKALSIFAGLEFLLNRSFNKTSMNTAVRYFNSIISLNYSI